MAVVTQLVLAALIALVGLGLGLFGLWPLSEVGQADGALTTGLVLVGLGLVCLIASGVMVRNALREARRARPTGRR